MHIISFIWTHFLSRIYFSIFVLFLSFFLVLITRFKFIPNPFNRFYSFSHIKAKEWVKKEFFVCMFWLFDWSAFIVWMLAQVEIKCVHRLDETVLRQIRRMHVEIDASDILGDYTPILTPLFTNCCVFSQWMFNADWQTAGRVPANGLPAQRNIHSHSENWTRSRKCCIYYIFDNVFSIQLIKYYGSKISESTIKITHASKMIQNSRFLYRFFLKTNH